jgi:hypothetical protein
MHVPEEQSSNDNPETEARPKNRNKARKWGGTFIILATICVALDAILMYHQMTRWVVWASFLAGILFFVAMHLHWLSWRSRNVCILLSVTLFVGCLIWYNNVSDKNEAPLTISPEVVDLSVAKGHTAMQDVVVHSRTEIAYYDIWVKATMNSPSIKWQNLSIRLIGASPVNDVRTDPTKTLDSMMVVTIPTPGTNFFSFKVGRLFPGDTKRFVFSYRNDGELADGAKHGITLSLERYTTTPEPDGMFYSPDNDAPTPKPTPTKQRSAQRHPN